MSRCPNCNYELVLLEHRLKCKCPKCSRLFPQNKIDTKEFVEWNKRQRHLALEKLKFDYIRFYKDNLEEPLPTFALS